MGEHGRSPQWGPRAKLLNALNTSSCHLGLPQKSSVKNKCQSQMSVYSQTSELTFRPVDM